MNTVSMLIGDGNLDFLNALRFFLHRHTREGLEVVGLATDDSELLAKAQALRPQIVVLNLRMALLSSLNMIPALRRVVPDIRAILLTLLESEGYRQAGLATGADDFVSKLHLFTDLIPAIRRVTEPAPELWRIAAEAPRTSKFAPQTSGVAIQSQASRFTLPNSRLTYHASCAPPHVACLRIRASRKRPLRKNQGLSEG
ncbi:MAG: response regulator transcription factor [Verrucomicrobiota bacterium]